MSVRVSDHALIRWLERAHGVDMEYFRDCLRERVEDAAAAGASSVIADGVQFRIQNNTLTTVLPGNRDNRIRAAYNHHKYQSATSADPI